MRGPGDLITKPSAVEGATGPEPQVVPVHVDLARGATIGRYTIIRRLGSGGMGIVYLAFDPELDRRVAVKLLRATANKDGPDGSVRLVREAQVMAKLSHPNVITVFDVGTFESDVFVAMEYVRGVTLREWCDKERRTPAETLAMCVQAGRGLAAAHEQGIFHRDFKPENILVDEQGRARVLDFGLARSGGDDGSTGRFELDDTLVGRRSSVSLPETQLGAVIGTPAYMAPEQMRSMPIDARSDQFAFCITTFEAVYGARPFPGETLGDVVKWIEAGRVVIPEIAGRSPREVPRGLLPVLVKGLASDPNARWRNMTELLAALEGTVAKRVGRTTVLLGVLGALVAVSAVVFGTARVSRASACGAADLALNGVWDAQARDEVRSTFVASGNVNASNAFPRVTKVLDEYAAGWVAMSTEACTATRVRGVQSDEALDLRSACLRQRLGDLRALADLLRHADGSMVDNALGGALRLEPIAPCADVRALRAAYEPVRADQRAAVETLRHDVANVVARFNAGRCEEALPLSTEVATRARAIGYAPVEAAAFYWAGRTAAECRDAKTASAYLFDAVTAAEESHQDELAARALVELTEVQGSGMSRYEEGISIARLAEASIRRVGSPDALLGGLAHARGWVEYTHGNIEGAIPFRREAIARHQRAVGDDDLDALQMHAELSDLEFEAGHLAVALAAQKDLLARSVALLGAGHQRVGWFTVDVAETLVAQGKYEEAAPWIARARPIAKAGPAEHLRYVEAVEHFGLGEVDQGAVELRALIALGEHDDGADDPYPLSTRADLAKWLEVHRRAGAGEEAAALVSHIADLRQDENPWYSNADATLAIDMARTGQADARAESLARHAVGLAEHGASQLPYALLALGEVLVARGDAGGAVAPLERALAMVAERGGIDATIAKDLEFALARAKAKR